MKLIVGLGNPGIKYSLTRHNIGFIALDNLAGFFKKEFKPARGDFYLASGTFNNEEYCLLKPTTYMNNSGIALMQFFENYSEIKNLSDLIVVHDDFNIPLGTLRVRLQGSDGGHNGVSSIIYHLNNDEFSRMRIGIGPGNILRKDEFIDFVLADFTEDEIEKIKTLLPVFNDGLLSFLTDDIRITMNKFNKNFLEKENNTPAEE